MEHVKSRNLETESMKSEHISWIVYVDPECGAIFDDEALWTRTSLQCNISVD
jgi:hypothetical protein